MNPSGKVPTIMYKNEVYYESLAVCDLLDEVFKTSSKLNPESAEEKAKVKMALADFDTTIRHFYTIIRSTKPMEELQEMKGKFQTSLQSFEAKLNGKFYFGGNEVPGMLDYMIWPWFERLAVVDLFHPDLGPLLPTSIFPKLVKNFAFVIFLSLNFLNFFRMNGKMQWKKMKRSKVTFWNRNIITIIVKVCLKATQNLIFEKNTKIRLFPTL